MLGNATDQNLRSALNVQDEDDERIVERWHEPVSAPGHTPLASPSWSSQMAVRGRHTVQSWRLRKSYVFYSLFMFVTAVCLCIWDVVKGYNNNWSLPQWKHHWIEEVVELVLCGSLVLESLMTICVMGGRGCLTTRWAIFDGVVCFLAIVSMIYALDHLGQAGEVAQATIPLLALRFLLQPLRVLRLVIQWRRARASQLQADIPVAFNWADLQETEGTLIGGSSDYQLQSEDSFDRAREPPTNVVHV